MCARRFLILIFVLTLIFVGGAFALYQWGDQVLVRMATPRGHYQQPPKDSDPDYSKGAAWWAMPEMADDPSRWVPDGQPATTIADPVATFYVHPTTYLERDRWNAPSDAMGEPGSRARLFVQTQAGAFNLVSRTWAPKYRQAAYGAFLLKSADAQKALDLAYRDVLAAFDNFLSRIPSTRPIIVAGHSQGSMHVLRLLKDRRIALKDRLVAAYIVGWPVGVKSDLPATGLTPCLSSEQIGCVLSWQSFKEPANTKLVTEAWVGTKGLTGVARSREEMLCTNPLTGTKDDAAGAVANLGTLVPNGSLTRASLQQAQVGAHCDRGFLIVEGDIPNLGPYVLPGNNFHVYDYALFWGSIRADAGSRVATWLAPLGIP